MIGSERLLGDCQGPLEERLGLGVAALGMVQTGQVVEGGGDRGMARPEGGLVDLERALVEQLGLSVAALGVAGYRCGGLYQRPL